MFRRLPVAFGLLLLQLALFAPSWASAQSPAGAAERSLFQAVNRERRAQGLPVLRWDDALASAARQHAGVMAQHRSVAHTLPGEASLAGRATRAGVRFSWLSENVVQAADASTAHEQFMHSPTHRANILDGEMNVVGIGVVEHAGQLFVVQDFAKAR